MNRRFALITSAIGNRPNLSIPAGCRIEERRFEQVDRVERALALYLIAAWRTMFVTWMGRHADRVDRHAADV